jgi:hypothetical protein
VIVKLGSHNKNPMIAALCERISRLEGVSRRDTPQRCFLKLGDETLATLGIEEGTPVIEFRTRKVDYAAAHGSSFVVTHPQTVMARQGWLQARPTSGMETDKLVSWIAELAKEISEK